eukprot:scaffold30856_cov74-Skeletonema_dohrnii-CCMP3373.AAC.3
MDVLEDETLLQGRMTGQQYSNVIVAPRSLMAGLVLQLQMTSAALGGLRGDRGRAKVEDVYPNCWMETTYRTAGRGW